MLNVVQIIQLSLCDGKFRSNDVNNMAEEN